MSDPLTDPRALALETAKPAWIEQMGEKFIRMSHTADAVRHGVEGARSADWQGTAADEYRAYSAGLPIGLHQLSQSFCVGASALTTYASEIGPLQPQWNALAEQLRAARGHLATTTTANDKAAAKASAPHATAADGTLAGLAQQAMSGAQGEVAGLESQCWAMLKTFQGYAEDAQSWLDRSVSDLPPNAQMTDPSQRPAAIQFIGGMVTGTAAHLQDLVPAAEAYIEHPNGKNASRFLGDFAALAATIGTIAAIAACPADGPVAVALDNIAEGADDTYMGTMTDKTAVDLGDGDGTDALDDLADMGLDQAGTAFDTARGLGQVDDTVPAYEAATSLKRALAAHPGELSASDVSAALDDLPAAERAALENAGIDLRDPEHAKAFIGMSDAEHEAAEADHRYYGGLNAAMSFDGGAATDQARDQFLPEPTG